MEITLRQDALSEAHSDIQNLIYCTIHKFINTYGCKGDYSFYFEELKAEANLLFIEAFDKFDETQSRFPTWVHKIIWNGLKNSLHSSSVKPIQTIEPENMEIFKMSISYGHFKFIEILMDASKDALYIITLILSLPDDLQKITLEKGNKPRNVRAAIRRFLLGTGWTVERIRETFREIQELLK